ncbi:F-box protein, partial [Trifolium medium]|nr:F-box protein [Trifolium medium]
HPLINYGYDHRAVSTCHGILCVGINQSSALLCNPSIRKFKELPPLDNSAGVIVSLDLEKESYQDLLQPLYDKAYFPHYDLGVFLLIVLD